MLSLHERYSEMLALTKLYLTQEYALSDRILSEPETYSYFKAYALQNQKPKSQPQPQVQIDPSRPDKSGLNKAVTSHRTPNIESGLDKAVASHHTPNKVETVEHNGPDKSGLDKVVTSHRTPNKIELDLPAAATVMDFADLRKIILEKLPQVNLLDQIPDDSEAKELANIWLQEKQAPQVLILSFDEAPKHQLFLDNIAKALKIHQLNVSVVSAAKLERNQEWKKVLQSSSLKLVVASSSGFYNLPELQKHYREGTKQGRHYLGDHLLLLLSDIGFYLKEPALKPSLWGALKELLAASKTL